MSAVKIRLLIALATLVLSGTTVEAHACTWWDVNANATYPVNVYRHGGSALSYPVVILDFWGSYYNRYAPNFSLQSIPTTQSVETMLASPFMWSRLHQYGVDAGSYFANPFYFQTSMDNIRLDNNDIITKIKEDIDQGLPAGHDPGTGNDYIDVIFLGPSVHSLRDCSLVYCTDSNYWNLGYHDHFDYDGRHVAYAVVEYSTAPADNQGLTSHEIMEASTDPYGNGYSDDSHGEICDFDNPKLVPMSSTGAAQVWLQDRCSNDGAQTIGVYRTSNGQWLLSNSAQTGSVDISSAQFGIAGDIPVTGDWDGDGTTTIGVFRPSTGQWFLDNYADRWSIDIGPTSFGVGGDIPITGDWDGNGTTTMGIYRPSTNEWFFSNSNTTGSVDIGPCDAGYAQPCSNNYGIGGDLPVTGDWDGNGTTTIGAFRPSTSEWFLSNSITNTNVDIGPVSFGIWGDVPVTGDWAGQGKSTIGVFRPSTNQWFLDNYNDRWSVDFGPTSYGLSGDMPVVGRWTNF